MNKRETTVAERNRMVDLKLDGYSLSEIAEQIGWSWECVRKWWRRFRAGGRPGLRNGKRGKPPCGPMSTFPGEVRCACLRLKKQHPGWGAPVVRLRAAQRLGWTESELPCVSTIEKYWARFEGRLYQRYHKRHPTHPPERADKPSEPHQRWQADFKEQIRVAGLSGKVDVLNIRDEATPVTIGSFVYPAGACTGRDMQAAFRQAFERWGLPDRVQTDHDKRVVNNSHPHPFPTPFRLWLAGLGIDHDFALSAAQNGCSERLNRTWFERVVLGRQVDDLDELQRVSDEELVWLNQYLPSKGRACAGRPPLEAYPQALQPRRSYTRGSEADRFSLQRVYAFLSQQSWWRTVSTSGQITLGDQRYGIGMAWKGQEVQIRFDAEQVLFLVEDEQGQAIKSLPPKNLTVAYITGLDLDPPD